MPVFNMMQGGGTDHTPKSQPQISAVHNMQGYPVLEFNAMSVCDCTHILLLVSSSGEPTILSHATAALVSVTEIYRSGTDKPAIYRWGGCTYVNADYKYTALACNINKNTIFINQTGNAVVSG